MLLLVYTQLTDSIGNHRYKNSTIFRVTKTMKNYCCETNTEAVHFTDNVGFVVGEQTRSRICDVKKSKFQIAS